jgi:signal transduction histidine kinase
MISLTEASPLVEQIYLNTHDSMNRIFPWFDVTEQYVPDMDIPSFNFYYEADAAHNPDRSVEWTDAYLDPAGQGWMVSAIAPVYRGDFLEGVVGIDVTLGTVLNEVLQLDLPDGSYAMLLGRDGRILAMPHAAARDLQVEAPLTAGDYGPVHSETLQPDDLNLFARTGMAGLAQAIRSGHGGLAHIDLADGGRTAAWSMIDATGWTMLVMADESQVFSAVIAVGETFHTIGWAMLVVLGLFSALFFLLLYLRAQRHSRAIAEPLLGLRDMVRRIGEGDFRQTPVTSGIAELNATGEEVARMGAALGEANQRLVDADRELRRALIEAQTANRAKTEFLAKMSHELRTPLNAIIGFADLLVDRSACPGLAEQHSDFAEEIRCSGRHLLGLINDVLALSKIEAGQRDLAPAPIPVAGLFAEMRRATAAEAEARGLTVETAVPPALPALIADPQAARQILLKLLSNAVKFTPGGGTVTLGAEAEGEGEGEERMALWVADTGIGIPEDRLRDVLEPFQQVEGAYARGYGGTGLGLTIVRDLAELHGGEVRIDSRLGEGTRVTVRFPLQRRLRPAAAPAGDPALCA